MNTNKGTEEHDSREMFDPPETLKERIARFKKDPFEASRMKSVFQNGRECHDCSCHIAPPCNGCVTCEVCNKEY